jgi:hypothetical protein
MNKKDLKKWPWNGQPSKRHVWVYEHPLEICMRCGCLYNPQREARAAIYCFARPQWLASHPNDDKAEG